MPLAAQMQSKAARAADAADAADYDPREEEGEDEEGGRVRSCPAKRRAHGGRLSKLVRQKRARSALQTPYYEQRCVSECSRLLFVRFFTLLNERGCPEVPA